MIYLDEAKIRYRAKRAGYSLMQTRGDENRRREKSGVGTYVLLCEGVVALHAATLHDIAEYLDRARKQQLH